MFIDTAAPFHQTNLDLLGPKKCNFVRSVNLPWLADSHDGNLYAPFLIVQKFMLNYFRLHRAK